MKMKAAQFSKMDQLLIMRDFVDTILVTVLFFTAIVISMPISTWAGSKIIQGTQLPHTLIGTWQVTKVLIDTGATHKLDYQYNDPILRGRLVWISTDKLIMGTPYEESCNSATVASIWITPGKLIKDSMAGRGFDPQTPTTKDYDLPLAPNLPIEVLRISCNGRLFHPSLGHLDGINGVWIIAMPDGKLAMRYYGETILMLSRLPANAEPKASFDCAKAITPIEKTICGSIELASFDFSIAESYKQNIKGFTEGKDPLAVRRVKAAQKAWLKKRNACGTNTGCLKKSMEKQLEYMANLENFYLPR